MGTHNLPDITCFYTLICDDDVASLLSFAPLEE